jgi:hypothetical protein
MFLSIGFSSPEAWFEEGAAKIIAEPLEKRTTPNTVLGQETYEFMRSRLDRRRLIFGLFVAITL